MKTLEPGDKIVDSIVMFYSILCIGDDLYMVIGCCVECKYLDLVEGGADCNCPRWSGRITSLGVTSDEWNKLNDEEKQTRINATISRISNDSIIDNSDDVVNLVEGKKTVYKKDTLEDDSDSIAPIIQEPDYNKVHIESNNSLYSF